MRPRLSAFDPILPVLRVGHACLAGLLLAGCASASGSPERSQPLTWIRFVNGADLRDACGPGAPDRFRMIHRQEGGDHVEAVEVRELPDGALVEARMIPVSELARLGGGDILGMWQANRVETRLTAGQFVYLQARLAASGVFDERMPELGPHSSARLWVINGCHVGSYFLSVYARPAVTLEEIRHSHR